MSAEHCLQCEAGDLAGVTRAWLRQAFSRTLRSQKHNISRWAQHFGACMYLHCRSLRWRFPVSLLCPMQFDLDEHFASERLRLAQLTNKCTDDDLEFYVRESGEVLGVTSQLMPNKYVLWLW